MGFTSLSPPHAFFWCTFKLKILRESPDILTHFDAQMSLNVFFTPTKRAKQKTRKFRRPAVGGVVAANSI